MSATIIVHAKGIHCDRCLRRVRVLATLRGAGALCRGCFEGEARDRARAAGTKPAPWVPTRLTLAEAAKRGLVRA